MVQCLRLWSQRHKACVQLPEAVERLGIKKQARIAAEPNGGKARPQQVIKPGLAIRGVNPGLRDHLAHRATGGGIDQRGPGNRWRGQHIAAFKLAAIGRDAP